MTSITGLKQKAIQNSLIGLVVLSFIMMLLFGRVFYQEMNKDTQNDFLIRTKLVAKLSSVPMMFKHRLYGEKLLHHLGEDARISLACMMTKDGYVVAEYRRERGLGLCQQFEDGVTIKESEYIVSQPVYNEVHEQIGSIVASVDTYRLFSFAGREWIVGIILVSISGLVMLGLLILTYRRIFSPLSNLESKLIAMEENGVLKETTLPTDGPLVQPIAKVFQLLHNKIQRTERDLQQQMRDNHAKRDIIATMVHELRTPLHSVLLLTEMMDGQSEHLSKTQLLDHNKTINEATSKVMVIINDMLDVAKAEAGKLRARVDMVNLVPLLLSLERQFSLLAKEKRLGFSIYKDSSSPDVVVTDGERLEQILRNLLSNAFKFTSQGEVRVGVNLVPPGTYDCTLPSMLKDQPMVAITVRDTGIGIPKGESENIFNPYHQISSQEQLFSTKGLGLGLSISKELAKLLGVEIILESSEKGTCFTLLMLQYRSAWERSRVMTIPETFTSYEAHYPITRSEPVLI